MIVFKKVPVDHEQTFVPNHLIEDTRLSPDARMVIIYGHAIGYTDLTQDQIQDFLGCGKTRLKTVLRELTDAGWIGVDGRKGDSK